MAFTCHHKQSQNRTLSPCSCWKYERICSANCRTRECWLKAETRDNALEYKWEAAFGTCSPAGRFEAGEYSFGVQLFKFPVSAARSGQLEALLREAQHTFVQREASATGISFRMVPGTSVSSEPSPEALRITVRGIPEVSQLLANLPQHALLTVNVPDPERSFTCYARVEYR